jgi:hypothetical protein
MRCWPLVALLLVSACSFRVPRGIPVRVSGSIDVRVQGQVRADTVLVPLQGAPVAEFFGIPLADVKEVLFVLDISGSMADRAEGQLALIPPPPPPNAAEPPPPGDDVNAPAGSQPWNAPPPTGPPSGSPPSAPPQMGPPPNATSPNAPPPTAPPPNATSPNAPPPAPMGYPPGYPPPSSAAPPASSGGVAFTAPTKLEVAQSELIEALARLPVGTRLNILVFNDEVDAYAPTTVVIDEARRADLVGFVREMRAVGATALQPALRLAFLLNAPRIVLLSDGLGNVGLGTDEILRDTREAVRGGVRIDAIGIGRGHDAKLLTTLATETGGLYQPL